MYHRFLLFFIVLWSSALNVCAAPAVAQRDGAAAVSPQLALARIGASEIGLTGAAEELAAIRAVLEDRMAQRHWTFLTAARLYSSRVFNHARIDGRAWVANLRPDGREPAGWPITVFVHRRGVDVEVRHAPWAAFRDRWRALYAASGRVLSGQVAPICDAEVHFWGRRTGADHERAVAYGWQETPCWVPCAAGAPDRPGLCPTRNAFWSVPARLADRD